MHTVHRRHAHPENGKELCDLLAVFENQVFIFVDRESRKLHATLTDWHRWKREAIDAQVRSVHGAERYLKMGRPVFLDPSLKVDKASMQIDERDVLLSPGMAVSAEIAIGRRRVIEFFLNPIRKTVNEGLRER